jgi:hypothetical protein
MERHGSILPASVSRVRLRVELWREQGFNRWRMPEELWAAAVSLARTHGVGPIARALRLDHGSLRKRMDRDSAGCGSGEPGSAARFVEIDPLHLVRGLAESSGAVVELSDMEGTKLVVRLGERESLDVPALVEAFRRCRS